MLYFQAGIRELRWPEERWDCGVSDVIFNHEGFFYIKHSAEQMYKSYE